MNGNTLPDCDFDDPGAVVSSFIESMNKWELESWKSMRAVRDSADPGSYQENVLSSMNAIFEIYCTKKDRKYGRLGAFQKPPVYDLRSEKILSANVDSEKQKAEVETVRDALLAGGKYRYVLHRKENKWLIDSLKKENRANGKRPFFRSELLALLLD